MALHDGVQISKVVTLVEADSFAFAFNFVLTASLVVLGYCCYMLWKEEDWSFSDVMFAKEDDMANAKATLDAAFVRLNETLAVLQSRRKQVAMGLDSLDRKLNEQKEISGLIANKVAEIKSKVSRLDDNVESIYKQKLRMLGESVACLESKQDETNRWLNLLLTKFPSPASRVSNYMKQGGK